MDKISKRTWETYKIFEKDANGAIHGSMITFVENPLPLPKGVDDLVRENWNNELAALQKKQSSPTEIKPYHKDNSKNPLNALYDANGKCISWPGPGISLNGDVQIVHVGMDYTSHRIAIPVGQTSYPFSSAIKDPRIKALYEAQGVPAPGPILGISTFVETADSKLTLTVRGDKVRWPNRLYAPGGQPESVDMKIIEHQMNEITEELNMVIGQSGDYHFTPDFKFGGILLDKEIQPGKPELTGWVKTALYTSEDITACVHKRKIEDRPKDVIDVAFAPATHGGLFDYLVAHKPEEFVSMTYGGLVLYGLHNYGEDWAKDILKKIE